MNQNKVIRMHKGIKKLLVFVVMFMAMPALTLANDKLLEVEIITGSSDALQQFQLPERLFAKGNIGNLNQILIVDKFGAPLPFEISKYKNITQRKKRTLKVYALKESKYLARQTDNISLKYDSRNRLTEVNRSNSSSGSESVMGYLIDFGENHPRGDSRISFELSNATDTSFLKFNIDKSSNLKNWRLVTRGEVLAQLVNNGVITKHNTISLRNVKSRYIRLTFLGKNPPFQIYSAEQSFKEQTAEHLSWTSLKEMQYNEEQQAYLLDVSAGVNYTTLQIEMPPAPSIITGTFSHRANEKSRWSHLKQVNFINIDDENSRIMEDQMPIWIRYKTQLKFNPSYSSPAINKQPLLVKLAYQAQKITFFANGNWPYKIQLGSSLSNQNNQNNPQLLATIKRQSGNSIGMATLGSLRSIEVEAEDANINWRKILLWIVLVVGVILMAWMAKNLLKQMD